MGTMECCPCESLRERFDLAENRNKVAAILSGGLFFTGWWLAIDASVSNYPNTRDMFHLCGVFSAISMFMVNTVSTSQLRGEAYTEGVLGGVSAKIWFFFGFLMGFGSLLGSLWILFGEYLSTSGQLQAVFPGVEFVMQNLLILAASLVYRFGRTEDLWG